MRFVPITAEIEEALLQKPWRPVRVVLFAYHGVPYDITIRALAAEARRLRADEPRHPSPRPDGLSAWLKRRYPGGE